MAIKSTVLAEKMHLSLTTETIIAFAAEVQQGYEESTSAEARKKVGHFGTSPVIAKFMAGMFTRTQMDNIRILDPGAGTGILTAAVCDRIASLKSPKKVEAVLYENEPALIELLYKTMAQARHILEQRGHEFDFQIIQKDFVLSQNLQERDLFQETGSSHQLFDLVIMNPPYYKLRKMSQHAKSLNSIVHGQPNIYALFMAVGAELLKDGGEIVAITPRSYCSGLYFRDFRRWFFDRINPFRFHIFESRAEVFRENGVLQENIILAGKKGKISNNVKLTVSSGRELTSIYQHQIPLSRIIDNSTKDRIVRLSSNALDQRITDIVDSWPVRFRELGLAVSTGPIVSFRAREFLLNKENNSQVVPLLSMHNVRPFTTVWPANKNGKAVYFEVCEASKSLLVPMKNYVLLKRFTSKEEKRRIVAGILMADNFLANWVGLENHLNYVYKLKSELSKTEAYGLAALLNSALIDRYFRTINGNTQVNATEIRTLPLLPMRDIKIIGEKIQKMPQLDPLVIEEMILDYLGINRKIKDYLQKISVCVDGDALDPPVGVAVDRAGALLVADDVGNAVWRVTPAAAN